MTQYLRSAPLIESKGESMKAQVDELMAKGIRVTLHVILVGDHAPSVIYTQNKKKFIEKMGATCLIRKLPQDILPDKFLQAVEESTHDRNVHGVLIQLPLPQQLTHLDTSTLVPPEKDVDGFHLSNMAQLFRTPTETSMIPCTPKGIMTLLDYYHIPIAGKRVVIIGRSNIVGKPLAMLMLRANATVTICHSHSLNIEELTNKADIIVTAIGKARFFGKKFVEHNTQGCVLVDVGIHKLESGKLCGDMDFDEVAPHASAITPVPGGIGPMTIFSLAENLLAAAKKSVAH